MKTIKELVRNQLKEIALDILNEKLSKEKDNVLKQKIKKEISVLKL